MAWHRTGNKPLFESMLAQFNDQYASPGLNKLILVILNSFLEIQKYISIFYNSTGTFNLFLIG